MTRLSLTSSTPTAERRTATLTTAARSRTPRLSTPASSTAAAAAPGDIDDGWFALSPHWSSSLWMRSRVSSMSSPEEHSAKTAPHCGCSSTSAHGCTDSNRSPSHARRTLTMAGFLQPGLLLSLCLAFFIRSIEGSMDITAFEYQRKFHKPLNLGECPQREVAIDLGNNSMHIEEQRCTLHQAGTVMHLPRELNDSRNVLITSPGGIVAYLGLCGGEAASFLGILNSGDCVAVEIASRLTFNEKTMIRAFVGYYRKSLDILDSQTNSINDGMDRYYSGSDVHRDKFYLKNRSYGTLEIIFVQFRFRTSRLTSQAKSIELPSPVMSDYMKAMERAVGRPQSVIVINLSTATQETYELKRFKESDWDRAVRDVQVKELRIQKTRDKINTNALSPHLKYQLFPFMDTGDRSVRLTNPIPWEKISMLEVQLRQAIELAKKTCRKCRGNKTKLCRRVRELRRKLISAQAEIHKGRSNWVKLTTEEKSSFATRYTARVKSYSSVTRSLAKSVREMRKNEKMKKLTRKRNLMNQIPMRIDKDRQGSSRRIRHSRRRTKVRKG